MLSAYSMCQFPAVHLLPSRVRSRCWEAATRRSSTPPSRFSVRSRNRISISDPSGSGTTMKLVVNTLLGVGMQAVAEAVALGEKAGLNRDRLLDVLSHTAVIAPAHVGKLKKAAANDYSRQFATAAHEQRLLLDSGRRLRRCRFRCL